MEEKRTVRWRFISDAGAIGWSCWEVDGERIIVGDPKVTRHGKGRKGPERSLDDRVLRVLYSAERRRSGRRRRKDGT